MPSMRSLLNSLRGDYPQFSFEPADEFWWSASRQCVYYNPKADQPEAFILHELSHAILGHSGYTYDINLIKLERDAWELAQNSLSQKYNVSIKEDIVQENIDTYRTWLHARSKCPECEATGIQTRTHNYICLACGHPWQANEARVKALRRYSLT